MLTFDPIAAQIDAEHALFRRLEDVLDDPLFDAMVKRYSGLLLPSDRAKLERVGIINIPPRCIRRA